MEIRRSLLISSVLVGSSAGCVVESADDAVHFGGDEADTDSAVGTTSAAETTDLDETSDEPGSSGGDAEDPGEPSYPRPTPLEATGECPEGFFGPITFDHMGWVCIPTCTDDDPPMCPSGLDGNAEGACATNPMSSANPCTVGGEPCTETGEQCGNIGMGQTGCLLPPSHCILRCGEGQLCPSSMTCSPTAGICQYVP